MIGHSHNKAGELTLGSDSLCKLCHIPKKSPNFPLKAVKKKKPNPQLLHLLTHKLKAMAVVIPEKDSLLLKLTLGLFLFSNLCSPPEASSRLLGTEGAPDSTHRRPTWDSEAGVNLRL